MAVLCALALGAIPVAGAQTVQLAKVSQGGTGTFAYTMTNLSDAADSIVTTTAGTPTLSTQVSTVAIPALPVSITEAANPVFELDGASCSDTNAAVTGNPASFGTLAGNTLVIAPANLLPDAAIVCTFTNLLIADVSVAKSATPGTVRTGGVVSYTLTVNNAGPGNVTGVQLSDTPGAGLDCTAPSPTAACSASGGASCPGGGATVPVNDLVGAGVTIPDLPAGGQVVVTLQCTVTASGQ
ncbi:hypothetical protein WQ53_07745 [Pseudoxanthomonas suwonensis]|uniref:Uncharacterized protein n=1 Tax=Pseudoxanthomonas suwonensis TaxID=314722 RepID=A0A0E3UN67_9GAMM|nr:hypothetical protein WQ53_07745 [Pseudoxanthomonas suwonensis]